MKLKKIWRAGIRYLLDSDYRFLINAGFGFYNHVPDDEYLERKFKAAMGTELDLADPKTFNEKLQWLKLYDRKPEYTMMVDKLKVRGYIKETLGEEYLIPLLGSWDDPDEIDFDALPNQFVLKCNHNSGLGMCICKDKSKLDVKKVKAELKRGLKQNYYLTGREWPYKDVKPRIIAEQYLTCDGRDIDDYKVHNFNGIPKMVLVCRDRFKATGLTEDFYSDTWEHLDVKRPNHPNAEVRIECPEKLKEMLELSTKLAKGIPFVRTDFYVVDHKVYFGEITFYPASGFGKFVPEEWDHIFGEWIVLPERK